MKNYKKTKIVATIGPASDSKKVLKQLIKHGMNIARINFSHGNYAEHLDKINKIKELEKELNIPIPIMLDTRGPEIRLHTFYNDSQVFKKGQLIKIFSKEVVGDDEGFSVTYDRFYSTVKPRQLIKIDDGKFVARVIKIEDEIVYCKACTTHTLSNRKGVNIIGGRFNMPFLSQRDIEDITFGVKNNISLIAASFVRSSEDLLELRALLKKLGRDDILIISKVESKESLSNLDEIIKLSDAIMVARGDLGVEIDAFKVPIIQQELITKSRQLGKPVIIATQMLESMQYNLMPTRAEVSDVALAISQGADCVMLSAESASGEYPVESCKMQMDIALTIEKDIDYLKNFKDDILGKATQEEDSLASAVSIAAIKSRAKLIVVFDEIGKLTTRLAKKRPIVPVICITNNLELGRRLQLYYGIYAYVVDDECAALDDNKFIYLKKVIAHFGIKTKSNVLLVKTKHKGSFDLHEESMRIVTIGDK